LIEPTTPREIAPVDALDEFAATKTISRSVAAYSCLMAHSAGIIPTIGLKDSGRICEAASAINV